MRRLFTIITTLLLAVAFALPSSAAKPVKDKNVTNTMMTAYTAQSSWGFGSEEEGWQRYGHFDVWEMEAGTMAGFHDSFNGMVLCDEGDPENPDDDYWADEGYDLGTSEEEGSPGALTIDGKYDQAYAEGWLTVYGQHWNNCPEELGGYFEEVNGQELYVAMELWGTTPILRERNSSSVNIPSMYNEHQSSTFRGRYAEGWIWFDWDPWSAGYEEELWVEDGRIGLMQFKMHSNG